MRLSRLVTGIVAACAAVAMSAGSGAAGQMAQGTGQAATAKARPQAGMGADMNARCQAMMADHETMMAELQAGADRLDALVSKMNAAPGTEKSAATAAVVNEMVAQRRTLRDGMMKMEHGQMGHMMAHMQAGKDAVATCPMMKQMGGMKPMGGMKH